MLLWWEFNTFKNTYDTQLNKIRTKLVDPELDPKLKLQAQKQLKSLNEIGKLVKSDFEYNSGTNKQFLTISEIRKMNLSNKIDTFSGTS